MTALAPTAALPLRHDSAEAPAPAFGAEILGDLAAAEALWRELEAAGVASPYQRFDWQQAYVASLPDGPSVEIRVLLVRDGAGRPALLMPLCVERRHGLRIGLGVGAKHASYCVPVMAAGAPLPSPAELRDVLREIGRALRLDAYVFTNLPLSWGGLANPLAEGGRPSPSNGYRLALKPDGEATLARALSKDARKKLRQKDKKLRELGPVAHLVARTAEDVEAILASFFAHKRVRFRELGIPNPFEDPATRRFLHAAATAGLARGRPAIELHALALGDRIVASFGAAVDDNRCCGMFTAFDPDPEIARTSPGELLMIEAIRHQCRQGRRMFDLGVGEARYKSSLCDEVEELVDATLPLTLRGRLWASAVEAGLRLKRIVKQTPWLWNAACRLRGLRAKAA